MLVCGGRENWDHEGVARELGVHKTFCGYSRQELVIITGGANGIDSCALSWAMKNAVKFEFYPAEWNKYGRKAGPIRNTKMIVEGKPDFVIAFKGGRGTLDMVTQAKAHGIEVKEIE